MTTTQEENDRLTRIGPGTPMGNLLRRYWHPVGVERRARRRSRSSACAASAKTSRSFAASAANTGLIDDRCPHRCMSMEYGIPDECGLRCAYHGWLFDAHGHCLEQPFEERRIPKRATTTRSRSRPIRCRSWAACCSPISGPQPAPLLPRWDLLVRDDLDRAIEIYHAAVQLAAVHGQLRRSGALRISARALRQLSARRSAAQPPAMKPAQHVKIEFDVFSYGIMKRRLLEGEPEDVRRLDVGHPLLFPNSLAQGGADAPGLQFRVPIDDTHTLQILLPHDEARAGRRAAADRGEALEPVRRERQARRPTPSRSKTCSPGSARGRSPTVPASISRRATAA